MRNKVLVLLFAAAIPPNISNAQSQILGRWKATDNDGYIEIYKQGTKYYGKLLNAVMENGKPKLDVKNPSAAMRNNPLQGTTIVNGFEDKGDGVYENGTVYDPQSGKSYEAKLTVKGSKLDMRAFVGVSIFGKTVTWRRAK